MGEFTGSILVSGLGVGRGKMARDPVSLAPSLNKVTKNLLAVVTYNGASLCLLHKLSHVPAGKLQVVRRGQ